MQEGAIDVERRDVTPQTPTPHQNIGGTSAEQLLFHREYNSQATDAETIILLHGLLSSSLEYEHVIPHLTGAGYHVLAADLPGHSGSRGFFLPASSSENALTHAATLVAGLIRSKGHDGKAHVVGLSMGGFVSLELCRMFPERCKTVLVTGAAPFENRNRFFASRPALIWYMMKLIHYTPDWLYWKAASWRGLVPHKQLLEEMRENLQWEVVRGVYSGILGVGWDEMEELGGKRVRIASVAGGLQDDVPSTKRMGEVLRGGGDGCKAFVVRDAVHAWDLQFPELFARGVLAWVEGREMPAEYEVL